VTSQQYEELCRYFVACELGVSVEDVRSLWLPGPQPPDAVAACAHQIDLFWETANAVTHYLNIANAKWRTREKIQLQEVLLLQQVKVRVGANKAIMITNTDFTSAARLAAEEERIGLLIVLPQIETRRLHPTDRELMQRALQEAALRGEKLYSSEAVWKGMGPAVGVAQMLGQDDVLRVRVAVGLPSVPAAPGLAPGKSTAEPGGASPRAGSGIGAYPTRHGAGARFRAK
jgi:hypothetical protein